MLVATGSHLIGLGSLPSPWRVAAGIRTWRPATRGGLDRLRARRVYDDPAMANSLVVDRRGAFAVGTVALTHLRPVVILPWLYELRPLDRPAYRHGSMR